MEHNKYFKSILKTRLIFVKDKYNHYLLFYTETVTGRLNIWYEVN